MPNFYCNTVFSYGLAFVRRSGQLSSIGRSLSYDDRHDDCVRGVGVLLRPRLDARLFHRAKRTINAAEAADGAGRRLLRLGLLAAVDGQPAEADDCDAQRLVST